MKWLRVRKVSRQGHKSTLKAWMLMAAPWLSLNLAGKAFSICSGFEGKEREFVSWGAFGTCMHHILTLSCVQSILWKSARVPISSLVV